MEEFPSQNTSVQYKGQEARGYMTRWLQEVDPPGDAVAGMMDGDILYAVDKHEDDNSQDNTKGPYHYGFPSAHGRPHS